MSGSTCQHEADGTVTVRDRDTLAQVRIPRENAARYVRDAMKTWTRPV